MLWPLVMCTVRFLVLDPHYTGRDDLKIIISKVQIMCSHVVTVTMSHYAMQGWCGWKAVSFWDKRVSVVLKLVPV